MLSKLKAMLDMNKNGKTFCIILYTDKNNLQTK